MSDARSQTLGGYNPALSSKPGGFFYIELPTTVDARLLLKVKHLRANVLIYLPRRDKALAQFEENLISGSTR